MGTDPLNVWMELHLTVISLSVFYYLRPSQVVILGTFISTGICEVDMGWACIYHVKPSGYGGLEMLSFRIVVSMGHWLWGWSWFIVGDLGTCAFGDVKLLSSWSCCSWIAVILEHL